MWELERTSRLRGKVHRKPQANLLPSKYLCGESQGRRDLFAYTGVCVSENGGYFYSCLMCYHIVFAYIYCIVCMVAGGHVYLFYSMHVHMSKLYILVHRECNILFL